MNICLSPKARPVCYPGLFSFGLFFSFGNDFINECAFTLPFLYGNSVCARACAGEGEGSQTIRTAIRYTKQ